MRNVYKGLLGVMFAIGMPVCAGAGEAAYQANDIIGHFANSVNQGASRGICVGTSRECEKSRVAAKPKPFDLLVTFEVNSERLTPKARRNLKEFAKALVDPRLSLATFSLEGHTDASGSESYNLLLSKRRAKSVEAFLVSLGVDPEKLFATGFGEFSPRTDNPNDKLNRRVETRIRLQ